MALGRLRTTDLDKLKKVYKKVLQGLKGPRAQKKKRKKNDTSYDLFLQSTYPFSRRCLEAEINCQTQGAVGQKLESRDYQEGRA